jgi:hypothetical protein
MAPYYDAELRETRTIRSIIFALLLKSGGIKESRISPNERNICVNL